MTSPDDETVNMRDADGSRSRAAGRGFRPSRRLFIGCALCASVAAVGGLGVTLFSSHTAEPPPQPQSPAPVRIITADEQTIRDNRATELDVFRFERNPSVLVLDFASLGRQGAMLNRVAAMIEKNGQPHDRALDATALDQAIRAGGDTPETFYYGHDYGALELGRFFDAMQRQNLPLTSNEAWLHTLLVQEHGLPSNGTGLGLISVPAVAGDVTMDMRATILHHELSHGEFFTNTAYRSWSHAFWDRVLDAPARAAFRAFLVTQNYDPALEDLLVNETQAYLMFTPNRSFFRPDLVGMTETTVADLRQRFRDGMPQGWLRDQAIVDHA